MNLALATSPSRIAAAVPPTAPVAVPSAAPPATPDDLPVAASTSASTNSWKLYDETTATSAIVDAVDGARQVVNAEFFGFSDAGKGAQLTTALASAASRGVEVNVVTDFISALALPLGSYQRMRNKVEDAGGSVILTSRIPFSPRAKETPGLKHVDHRKVVTVDGSTGFVGGMNFVSLSDDYHDSMVRLSGVAAARLAADQLERWRNVGGAVTEGHSASVELALGGMPVVPTDPSELHIINNAPDQARFDITAGYLDMIRGAKERLWIASPGISDRDVMDEVNAAAARGVDVRIIAPGQAPTGIPLIQWVGRAHLTDLVEHGGSAYEIPEVLHRKAIVADDEAILSSYNLTKRSATHDHEVGVRTTDAAFVDAVAGVLEKDMARGTAYDPSRNTGITSRLGGLIAKHMSY